jgi:hypothetical protein
MYLIWKKAPYKGPFCLTNSRPLNNKQARRAPACTIVPILHSISLLRSKLPLFFGLTDSIRSFIRQEKTVRNFGYFQGLPPTELIQGLAYPVTFSAGNGMQPPFIAKMADPPSFKKHPKSS